MELKQLCNKTLEIFEIDDIKCLQEKFLDCVRKNDIEKYSVFESLTEDLSVDWLQMVFQYYYADRKEKSRIIHLKRLLILWEDLQGRAKQ